MQHYFSNNQNLEHHYQTISYQLKEQEMQFTTDNGVFSKNTIDYGSKVLINAFEMPEVEGPLLDIGCGYGPIGLTLAKAYRVPVIMCDINERALDLARGNARLNQVLKYTTIKKSNIYENIIGKYQAILTNPPIRAGKDVVHQILAEAIKFLEKNGELWVVIQKKQGAPSAKKKMLEIFGNCEIVTKDKGYYVLRSLYK